MQIISNFSIYPSLSSEISSPAVWISEKGLRSRSIVKITNLKSNKSVWCEILIVDDNYKKSYNAKDTTKNLPDNDCFLVINSWYREILSLEKGETASIKIEEAYSTLSWLSQIFASLKHPDNTVRLAVDLAVVSLLLGAIGLFLGTVSLFK